MRILQWFSALRRERERSADLYQQLVKSDAALRDLASKPILIAVNRNGREVTLTFIASGEIHRLVTYAPISFNLSFWQRLVEGA